MDLILLNDALPDKADHAAHLFGIGHIFRCHFRNAFRVNVFKIDKLSGDDRGKDRELTAGIPSLDIRARVRLGKALVLCFFENRCVVGPFIVHFGQHVVCRAVYDTENLLDMIGCQAGAQIPDDRNTAADARLKQEAHIILLRQLQQFRTVGRDHRLVGGDYTLSRFQAHADKLGRNADTAHRLTDDADLVIIHDLIDVVYDDLLNRISRKIT